MADNSSLKKRITSSILILSLVAIIIFYFPNWVLSLLASFMIGCALWEFFGLVEKKGIFLPVGLISPFQKKGSKNQSEPVS